MTTTQHADEALDALRTEHPMAKPVGKRTNAYKNARVRTGWHVHTNNAYVGYQADQAFDDIVAIAEADGFYLVWIGPNILMFEDGTVPVEHVTY